MTFTVPIFAILSFLPLTAGRKATYLTTLMVVYKATALADLFLLLFNSTEQSPEGGE